MIGKSALALAAALVLLLTATGLGSATSPSRAELPHAAPPPPASGPDATTPRITTLDTWGIAAACFVGGAVGCLAAYAECLADPSCSGLYAPPSGVLDRPWLQELVGGYGNLYNSTSADLGTALSALNHTAIYFDTQAAWAAEAQIGNSSFQQAKVLTDGGIAQQLASVYLAPLTEISAGYNVTVQMFGAKFGGGGPFRGSNDSLALSPACESGGSSMGGCGLPYGAGAVYPGFTLSSSSGLAFIGIGGSQAKVSCPVQGGGGVTLSTTTGSVNNSVGWSNFQWPIMVDLPDEGLYSVSGTSGCSVAGPTVVPILNLTPTLSVGLCGGGVTPTNVCSPLWASGPSARPFRAQAFANGTSQVISPEYGLPYGLCCRWFTYALTTEIPALVLQAENVGKAYWLFLRQQFQGGAIPSNCLVPQPEWLMPPGSQLSLSGMSPLQLEAMFIAELNGLAVFFDTPLNSTTFCAGHPVFGGVGGLPWPVLGVNTTGYIYTLPPGAQSLSNPRTWTVGPSQLWVWPWERTVRVPLNQVFEVPSSDPLEAMQLPPPSTGIPASTWQLFGNGTLQGVKNGSSAGAAIYLTACTVNGTAANPCPLIFQQLGGIIGNVSCPPGSYQCTPPPPPPTQSPTGAGLGGPCSWLLVSFFCSILGGFANPFAWIEALAVAGLVLLFVGAGVFWTAGEILRRRRGA